MLGKQNARGLRSVSPDNEFFQLGVQARQWEEEEKKRKKEEEERAKSEAQLAELLKLAEGSKSNKKEDLTKSLTPNKGGTEGVSVFDELAHKGKMYFAALNPFDDVGFMEGLRSAAYDNVADINKDLGAVSARAIDNASLNLISSLPKFQKEREEGYDRFDTGSTVGNVTADLLGYLAPAAGAYKLARAIPSVAAQSGSRLGQVAKEGAVAGGIFAGGQSLVKETLDPDSWDAVDHLTNLGLNVGLGAVADVGLTKLGDVIKKWRSGKKLDAEEQLLIETAPKEQLSLPEPMRNADGDYLQYTGKLNEPFVTTRMEKPPILDVEHQVKQVAEMEGRTTTTLDDIFNTVKVEDSRAKFDESFTDSSKQKTTWNEKLSDQWYKMTKNWWDKDRGMRRLQRKESGRGNEYVYMAKTIEAGATPAAMNMVEKEIVPIFANLRKTLGQSSSEFNPNDNVMQLMLARQAKTLIEKQGFEAGKNLPSGMTLNNVDEIINKYKGSAVEDAANEIRVVMDNLLDMLRDSKYLSDSQYQLMKDTNPDYFPFFRDLEADGNVYEQAFESIMSPSKGRVYSRKEGSTDKISDPMINLVNHVKRVHQIVARQRTFNELHKIAQAGSEYAKVLPSGTKKTTNEITARINGKDVRMSVHKDFYESLVNPINQNEQDLAMGLMSRLARIQRASVIMTPSFMLKDALRSPIHAYVTSRAGFTPIDLAHSAIEVITNGLGKESKQYQEFIKNGAGMSSIWAQDINHRKSALKQLMQGKEKGFKDVANPLEWGNMIRKFAEYVEQVPKFAEYKATKRKGGSDIEAAFNAREIYDHQMAGVQTQKANRYIAFLNSNIRGKDKFMQALAENPARVAIRSLQVVAPPVLLSHLAYTSWATDEQRRKIDESSLDMKELYTMIPSPDGETIYKFPKPFEAFLLVGKPLEELLKASRGETYEYELNERLWAFTKNNIIHDPTLNPAMPFVELALNRDSYTGREIVDRYDNRPKGEQFEPTTSDISILLAQMFNSLPTLDNAVSPKQVEHLINGFLPVSGETGMKIYDRMFKENLPNERALSINPFEKAFNYDSGYSPTVGDFYETKDELDLERSEQGDDFLFNETRTMMNDIKKELDEIRDMKKMALESSNFTPAQKQNVVDELDQRRNELTRVLYDAGITNKSDGRMKMSEFELLMKGFQ